jgi:methyltransferase (TIGR00027 family)
VRPSLTARTVAVLRAAVDRPALASGDPEGEDRLAESLRPPVPLQLPGVADYIAARTQFFDQRLLEACEAGTRQVVIVGAGYDARSVRFRQPGVVFYELDHPGTQADKVARLEEAGVDAADVRFVPVDLGRDAVADALVTAGQDGERPTHFMCEGLTPYLPMAVLQGLLGSLADRAARGSTIAIDFADPGRPHELLSRLSLGVVRAGTAVMGERIVTMLSAEETESLLEETRWPKVDFWPTSALFPVVFAQASRA